MDERRAREVTLLEAFETAVPPSPSWSDDDRLWADRVAREAAGRDAGVDAFVTQRASHAMHRLREREPVLVRDLAGTVWRRGALVLVALLAFVVGVAIDEIGDSRQINLLAPPFWTVLAWNTAVYIWIVAAPVVRLVRRRHDRPERRERPRPFVRFVQRLGEPRLRGSKGAAGAPVSSSARRLAAAFGFEARRKKRDLLGAAGRRFASLWIARKESLAVLRAETLLHAGAAALGIGLLASMYGRGLVLDYRAVWESTFFDATAARALVATVFAPAAALSGIALPDAPEFAALRAAPGVATVGAPAAPWLHLIALTIAIFVIVPRAVLAVACAALAARRSRRFAMPLAEPYFQRLARLATGGAAVVAVFPYATTPSPQATLKLQALLIEAFGPAVDVRIEPVVAFGNEDEALPPVAAPTTHAIALFDLSATPEAEHHGRFVAAVGAAVPSGSPRVALVDEGGFARRFGHLAERLAQRREAWLRFGKSLGVATVLFDLEPAATTEAGRASESAGTRQAAGTGETAGRLRGAAALQAAFAVPRPAATAASP